MIRDRYYWSTVAYQGTRGADPNIIVRLNEEFAPRPDLLFVLDIEPALGLERIRLRGDKPNAFENEDSLAHARQIFNGIDSQALRKLDARESIADIHYQVRNEFLLMAANKISAEHFSPEGLNRTLQLFGGEELPYRHSAAG